MSRALSTIAAGWLLFHPVGGAVAFYETEADCQFAAQYAPGSVSTCVPDRFAVEEMRAQSQETKP